jgi:hypothetical protein
MNYHSVNNNEEKYTKLRTIWENSCIIPKSEFDKSSTSEEISTKFQKVIKYYYGVEHNVDFNKITKTSDDLYLEYKFPMPENRNRGIWDDLNDVLWGYNVLNNITEHPARLKSYEDLYELSDIYEAQLKDQSDTQCDKILDICKKYLKFMTKKKLKKLLNLDKDGNFIEVEQINYKLSLLDKFNKKKSLNIKKFLQKNGKTISNFNYVNNEWDSKNKENMIFGKMSNELKTDMATSGFNDKLV